MSWKNVKEHYRIGHIVQIQEGKILIGSGYCSDLINITIKDGTVRWGSLGESHNADLERYYSEMHTDLGKLKELIDTPDTFSKSIPVFTHNGAKIIEKECEEFGYSFCTHDGELMYDNEFFLTEQEAVTAARINLTSIINRYTREDGIIARKQKELDELRAEWVNYQMALEELNAYHPE